MHVRNMPCSACGCQGLFSWRSIVFAQPNACLGTNKQNILFEGKLDIKHILCSIVLPFSGFSVSH